MWKSTLVIFLFSIISCFQSVAQVTNDRCGTMDALDERMATDSNYAAFRNAAVNMSKSAASIVCNGTNSINVPIAFHFDSSFDCNDIDCILVEVEDQMAVLNATFASNVAASAAVVAGCPAAYEDPNGNSAVSTGTCINFCYAVPPAGNNEGLQDCDLPITIGEFNGGFNAGGNGAPGWGGIMNVFITAGNCLGVADGIPGAANGDGVTVCSEGFGGLGGPSSSCGSGLDDNGTYDEGKTLVHEIGHYLGLYHTFQGGCGTQEENPPGPFQILDTPPASSPYYGCNISSCQASSCSGGVQAIGNFMDYTDDPCMTMFTEDQAAVLNYWANQLFGTSNTACSAATDLASCGGTSASCVFTANFEPADDTAFDICLDDSNTLDLIDLSGADPVSWSWSINSLSGNLAYSPNSSSMQNPTLTFTGGTSGVLSVTLTSCDANGTCDTATHEFVVNLLSGNNCPNECDYSLLLTDTYGDGWNGASMEIFQNGVSVATVGTTFNTGYDDGPYVFSFTDGATIDLVQTNGGYPSEEGAMLTDAFGNIIFNATGAIGSGTVYSFTASCSQPTCSDGIQNGSETDIDCGGSTCAPCPDCPIGQTEILNENFDGCALPAGWTTAHTNTNSGNDGVGTCTDGVNFFAFDCTGYPSGGANNVNFSGCVAVFDDDNPGSANDPDGIGCIISPVVNLSGCTAGQLSFDWMHFESGYGSELYTDITYDGVNWTEVQSSTTDGNGSETIILTNYTANFQVRICFDDANDWVYGAAFDNVSICAACDVDCPPNLMLSNNIPDGTYEAGISIQSNGQVPAGGDVIMKAGDEIELQSGFDCDEDADLHIYIEDCVID